MKPRDALSQFAPLPAHCPRCRAPVRAVKLFGTFRLTLLDPEPDEAGMVLIGPSGENGREMSDRRKRSAEAGSVFHRRHECRQGV